MTKYEIWDYQRDVKHITCVTIDCADPAAVAHFWNEALRWGSVVVSESDIGRLAGQHGDLERASAMLNDSLTLQGEIGFKRGVELALLETATVARATAPTLTDCERLEFERARAEIKAGLDGETFAQLSSEGEAISIDAAVAYALDA